MVECVKTPLGTLIHRCTAFRPACGLRCARDCATELDREAREERETEGPVRVRNGQWILESTDEDWTP
jgi:hypothetical protein